MLQIVSTEYFEKNGVKYKKDIFNNGASVTTNVVEDNTPTEEPEPTITLEERIIALTEQLQPLIDGIRTVRTPSDKIGEDWLITYLGDMELTREYVPSLTPPTEEDGSYLHPFTYTVGMEVTEGMWYTDGEDIWEAIASGTPVDFTDREFFDIIEV